jgi:hypothetical protein
MMLFWYKYVPSFTVSLLKVSEMSIFFYTVIFDADGSETHCDNVGYRLYPDYTTLGQYRASIVY